MTEENRIRLISLLSELMSRQDDVTRLIEHFSTKDEVYRAIEKRDEIKNEIIKLSYSDE